MLYLKLNQLDKIVHMISHFYGTHIKKTIHSIKRTPMQKSEFLMKVLWPVYIKYGLI